MERRQLLQSAVSLLAGIAIPASACMADPISVTDLLGRTVTLERPAEKIILGEGRYLAAIGILDRKDPVRRLVGMLGDFKLLDPAGHRLYVKAFPGLAEVPLFGAAMADTVSVEKVIALRPELAIFGKSGHGPSARTRALVDKIAAAGIPIAFIDFRDDPLVNTPKSMTLLGRLLGREKQAAEFVRFYEAELARVTEPLRASAPTPPTVFLEARVGLGDACCLTMSEGMMGRFVDVAGGRNIAKGLVPGASGTINLEYLIASQPDIYIGTAIGSPRSAALASRHIVLGAGTDAAMARASLARVLDRKGIADLKAVRSGRAHAIWHHFYSSPLNVVAVQSFAKWFHPELFRDLDPRATLETLYRRFQPVPLDGVYWAGLR